MPQPVSFLKLVAAMLLTYVLVRLSPFLLLLSLSILLASAMLPLVGYLQHKRGFSLVWANILVLIGFFGLVAGTFAFVIPSLVNQISTITPQLPQIRANILNQFSESGHTRAAVDRFLNGSILTKTSEWLPHLLLIGQSALGGVSEFFLILILTVYLVLEAPKTIAWILAFFEERERDKLRFTANELVKVVSAYVYGQIITSFASFVYTYVALLLLKVPGALILAIMAAIFDVLPMLGFVLAIVPATLMALSVSPGTSLGVIGLYVLFHILENYFIMPLVYGNRLRLSTLVVLLGILVGALLGGVVGAVLALPVIASYPIIERIWLKDVLGTAVISRHILQTQAEVGSDS